MKQKIIYRNECQICHKKLTEPLDWKTHFRLSHEEIYVKIDSIIAYEGKYGETVFINIKLRD